VRFQKTGTPYQPEPIHTMIQLRGTKQIQETEAGKARANLQSQSQTIDSIEFATPACSMLASELYSNVRFAPGMI
jgi:hypothetical protein